MAEKMTMAQAVRAGAAFNPLSASDGQGEVYEGNAQTLLAKAMSDHGWGDMRFVTEHQINAAGWTLNPGAEKVQVTLKDDRGAWGNRVLYNAEQISGMPSVAAMLAVAETRIRDAREEAALPFMVASGGEVLLYAPDGKSALSRDYTGIVEGGNPKKFWHVAQDKGQWMFEPLSADNYTDAKAQVAAMHGGQGVEKSADTVPGQAVNAALPAIDSQLVDESIDAYTYAPVRAATVAAAAKLRAEEEGRESEAVGVGEDDKVFLDGGGWVPRSAQDDYIEAELTARAAYAKVMSGAPVGSGLLSPISAENQSFADQADAAYAEIEGPARKKRDEQRIPGGRLADDDLVVGPAKRALEHDDEPLAVTPFFKEREILREPQFVYAEANLLGNVFKERVSGSGEYVRGEEKKVAFIDKGVSLVVRDKQPDCYKAVMELAKQKGWTAIELSGKKEHLAKGWLEAQLLGIEVANYTPGEKDLAALDARREEMERKAVEKAQADLAQKAPEGAEVVSTGRHIGLVKDVRGGYAVQESAPGVFVAHDLRRFEKAPENGKLLDVQYSRDGKAMVKGANEQGKGQEQDGGRSRAIGGR